MRDKMKIVYLGCDLFYDCFSDLVKKHEVAALYTFKSQDVYESSAKITSKASEKGIPIHYERITRDEYFSLFEDQGAELLISAGYPYKIPVRPHDSYRAVNIHPSYLPDGRGNWPIPFAVLEDRKHWGVSLHLLSDKFDEGDILLQKQFRVTGRDTTDSLLRKCAFHARFLLMDLIRNFGMYYSKRKIQHGGKYYNFSDSDITVSKSDPAEVIKKKIRAAGKYGIIIKD